MTAPKKSLGQHWLRDPIFLQEIADASEIGSEDTVLEIGPGLGTLTGELLRRAKRVVSIEFDAELARKLPGQFPGKHLEVIHQDILTYDLSTLPKGYVVAANVPYYITSKIVQKLMTADNRPRVAVLLVQKEVAQRIAAGPGNMSVLAVAAQVYAKTELGVEVPREFFTPPPEVDSQVIILRTHPVPLVEKSGTKTFFRVVKAGFSARRKKLRSSLAGGLAMSKEDTESMLGRADISADLRAQDLSIDQWKRIAEEFRRWTTSS